MPEISSYELMTSRMSQLGDLYKRMDDTKDMAYLTDYAMTAISGPRKGKKIEDAVHITSNKPAVFLKSLIADLSKLQWQTVVEGGISDTQKHDVEMFIDASLEQADEFIHRKYGLGGLYPWLCRHICLRGVIVARYISQVVDKQLVIDCAPLDARWTPWEYGNDGWNWVGAITWRSPYILNSEYKLNLVGNKDVEVRDWWSSDKNEVWVDGKLAKSEGHSFGRPPFILSFSSEGLMLRDKDYLEHEAEDALYLIRPLIDELNRSLSIEATIAHRALFPAYEQEKQNPEAQPDVVPKSGQNTVVSSGERHVPVPLGDLNQASMTWRQDTMRMIDEGAPILPRQYSQAPSGAELFGEIELLNRLQEPFRDALKSFKEGMADLIVEQAKLTDEKTKGVHSLLVGRKGRKINYSLSQVGNPEDYSITYTPMSKSKRMEIANWALVAAARGVAPLTVILKDILGVDDTEGWTRDLELEKARNADEAIALFEWGVKYAQEAEDMKDSTETSLKEIQSKLLIERGIAIVKQRLQPQPSLPEKALVPQIEQPKPNANALMSLMGGQGAGKLIGNMPEESGNV